jgi:eukaryotic-like serine/threonine-protein kinase
MSIRLALPSGAAVGYRSFEAARSGTSGRAVRYRAKVAAQAAKQDIGRAAGRSPAGEAAQSKRLRAMGLKFGATTEEETRAWLQERLATFSKVLFWSFAALVGFLIVMYGAYPDKEPRNQNLIYGTAALSLAILAFIWRVVLLRGERSIELLNRIDLMFMVASGLSFGVIAPLAYDLNASSYTCLLYESFVVFTRALLIPSSARRTLIVSSLAFVPIVLSAFALAILDANGYGHLEIPGVAFVAGDILYNAVAVLLAVQGSKIIYELRQKTAEVTQLGVYTLGHKIGGGGMGEVYEAKHAVLRRPTAVKLIRPDKVGADNLDRFEREVQLTSQLTHPNTIAIFDYGRSHDGVLYYAMEYLDGINLEDLVRQHGAQPADRVVRILAQVASALAEAHERPDGALIHRDIKPANVILCQRGGLPDFAKIVDFGLVKELTRDTNASEQIIGTPHYMAPEIFREPDKVDATVDIYALGAVGYFLLTGKTTYDGKTAIDILIKQSEQAPRPFAEVTDRKISAEIEALIMKCLAKSSSERWASASALAAALDAAPRAGDWSSSQAIEWWKDYRKRKKEAPSHDAPTETMSIDLRKRSSSSGA